MRKYADISCKNVNVWIKVSCQTLGLPTQCNLTTIHNITYHTKKATTTQKIQQTYVKSIS